MKALEIQEKIKADVETGAAKESGYNVWDYADLSEDCSGYCIRFGDGSQLTLRNGQWEPEWTEDETEDEEEDCARQEEAPMSYYVFDRIEKNERGLFLGYRGAAFCEVFPLSASEEDLAIKGFAKCGAPGTETFCVEETAWKAFQEDLFFDITNDDLGLVSEPVSRQVEG